MATATNPHAELAARADDLTGRVALVTGGTRGIGAAITQGLASAGAVVAANFSSNQRKAEEFRAEIEANGGTASVHQGNIGDAADCKRIIGEVIKEHGQLDILVNNAGITVDKPAARLSPAEWDSVIQVNLSGAFYMSQPALGHMLARGSGRIINISSVSGETGNIGQVNYTAAKAGMFGLTKTLAREAALALRMAGTLEKGIGVTINCVTPGLIDTDMLVTVPPFMLQDIIERIPVHRMGQPEEIARVVRFLASDASGYITGQVWGVNGGLDM